MTSRAKLSAHECVPRDARALLIGRVWVPAEQGPSVVAVRGDDLVDLTPSYPTVSQLLNVAVPDELRAAIKVAPVVGRLGDIVANSREGERDTSRPWLLAPCEIQAIIGPDLRGVRPGSPEAARIKDVLVARGMWSQYLEVGIGPDAELFAKCPPMAAVGLGARVGIHPKSVWNNPEPELVLVINSAGTIVGVTLGNDVNLRDVEGRSALLLGRAKDNNASCAIGPFIRVLDDTFTLDSARRLSFETMVEGLDGFRVKHTTHVAEISRDLADLAAQAISRYHRYPDGLVLFIGTMFAPVADRGAPGSGFTHKSGDNVSIYSPQIGRLVNEVVACDAAEPWSFGTGALMTSLARRGLLR